jgi:hypothetical protein
MTLADEGLKMAVDSEALGHHDRRLTGLTDWPGLFMNTCYVVRSSRLAELFSFGLLDGLHVRLRGLTYEKPRRASVSNASRRHS